MKTFSDVIDAFPDGVLADHLKVPRGRLAVWKHRDKIPDEYWDGVVVAARAQEAVEGSDGATKPITAELLTKISAAKAAAKAAEKAA